MAIDGIRLDSDGAIPAYEKYLAARRIQAWRANGALMRERRMTKAIARIVHALKGRPANATVELNLALAITRRAEGACVRH